MTEAEAKKRWCPFTRAALNAGMAANRTGSMGTGGYADITDETRCIGSNCMAWKADHIHRDSAGELRKVRDDDPPSGDCRLLRSVMR